MSEYELIEWARRELEIRAQEDDEIANGADYRFILHERGLRRTNAGLSRTQIREALLEASMEWA